MSYEVAPFGRFEARGRHFVPLRYEGVGSGFVIAKGIALKQSTSEKVVIAKGEALKQSPCLNPHSSLLIAHTTSLTPHRSQLIAHRSKHLCLLWVRHILDFFEDGGFAYFRNCEFQYFGGGHGIVQSTVMPKVSESQRFR